MNVSIRPLEERDLAEADRIVRLAFGTFLGLPDPMSFMGDADLVRTRWLADPAATLGAWMDGTLVGSNFVTHWGSFAFFGPLTVRPDLWDKGFAQRLLEATMGILEGWGIRQAGLFTFPQSTKHLALYQKFGFWPQHLTPVMAKPIGQTTPPVRWSAYSEVPAHERDACIAACRALTHAVQPGLDLQREIEVLAAQGIGETVLVRDTGELVGFAVCHLGTGSEAGAGCAYVKFGAVRPGDQAAERFERLLSACEALADRRGMERLVAGVNVARHEAYRTMIARGFRTLLTGVAMQRPNDPGYNRPDCFVIDDWR